MRVHLTIKGLGLGGAERHVVDCALGLKARGHEVTVSYLLPHKDALVREIQSAGIDVYCLGSRHAGSFILGTLRLVALLRTLRPDVVHAHLPLSGIMARTARLFVRFRLAYTEHNLFERLHPLTRLAHRSTRFIDDCHVSCSDQVARSLPWPSIVVRNGIAIPVEPAVSEESEPVRSNLGIPEDAVIFICVANLLKKKNHSLLLKAFANTFVDHGHSVAYLLLVGQDGTERNSLERQCVELGIQDKVIFYGSHPHAARLTMQADVFCLSSSFEGLPIALLESMAAGMPAIVTDVGGMPDAVVDGVSGYVVRAGDESAMGRAMSDLHENSALRTSMGMAARSRVIAHYSNERMMEQLLECYMDQERSSS